MLKGINKQIIEIKCTENECFDKILLFVNANKNHLHPDILRKNAVDIASAITGDKMFSTNRKFNFAAVISTIIGVAMLGSAAYRIVYVISINIIDKICVNRRKSI